MTSTLEMANFIHVHALALRKLQSEHRQQEHHLRQLLGHVAVLESTDAFEYEHYVAPPAFDDKVQSTQNLASASLASLVEEVEQSPSVEVTECSDDEDEDYEQGEIYEAMPSDDDSGLTSDSSVSDDEHDDSDAENDSDHKLVPRPSKCLDGGCSMGIEHGKIEIGKVESVFRGEATIVDVAELYGKDVRRGGQDQVVSIIEWNDDGF